MLRRNLFVFWLLLAAVVAHPAAAQVVISELMADNASGIQDVDRDRSDWIEIHNFGNATVSLDGWFLTDSPEVLNKWRIPSTNLVSKGYLLIYASGKNRAIAGQQLHTSFSLSAGGEYLALVRPDNSIAFEFSPEFPQQSPNISYGLAANTLDERRFFTTPTPGAANSGGQPDVSHVPQFSLQGGAYANSVTVSLSHPDPNTTIRYTVNGTAPTAASPAYTAPLTFANTTVLRARAFTPGLVQSESVTQTYSVLGTELVNFSSNLPILILSTFGGFPNDSAPISVSAHLIHTNAGRATFSGLTDYHGRATIKIRGSSSTQFPKKSYAFELQDELGNDRKASLLDMPRESDWVLYAPYTDKTLMRDFLAYEWSNMIGRYAPRTRFVEVYLDTGGKLNQTDYQGVYVLIEKIKRDDDRVNIAPLLSSQNTSPEITGGYIWKRDRLDPGDVGFSTTRHSFGWVEPKEQEVTSAQRNYLVNYLTTFENALFAANFATTKAYTNYIDTEAAIDHHWMVEATRNIDGFRLSTYFHKDRLGKIIYGPVWDYNLTLGNANYADGWMTNGWYAPIVSDSEYPWYRRMFADNDFNQRYIDRWKEIRESTFVTPQVVQRVDSIANTLREAAARNYAKWPILGQYVWPNWYIGQSYQDEVNWMKWWLTNRLSWIDSQFAIAPQLSVAAGQVERGTTVTLTAGANPTIYYTTDGSDPRALQGGISPRATRYTGPITINANTRIVARTYRNNVLWSAPTVATYVVEMPPIVISEIMYNPATDPNGDLEFIELRNNGTTAINLLGYRFTGGVDYLVNSSFNLAAGASAIIVKNRAAFTARFPDVINIIGQYTGNLDNSGERIVLEGPMREIIHDFTYNNAWYPVTDGHGFSLVIRDASAARGAWGQRASWRASANLNGSPSSDDPAVNRPTILINEVLSHTDLPAVDAIELHNPGAEAVEIGNWFLSDDRATVKKFRIPAGRRIEPGQYLVFTEADFNPVPADPNSFALSSDGDEVVLFSADAAGNLTGASDWFSFGAAANGVSFGRHVASDGEVHYPAQRSVTLGAANSGPRVGPVVINEIGYLPIGNLPEFVELKNITAEPVALYDAARPLNRWRLSGVDFTFPANASIPANGIALVVPVDPGYFRTTYNVGPEVPVYGPYVGTLQDNGEWLELQRPDAPNGIVVPMIAVDSVRYNDRPAWPAVGPGAGFSLERINANAYGNDPANWRGAFGEASPGLNNDGNRRPIVVMGEAQFIVATRFPLEARLTAQATDDGNPADPGRLTLSWSQAAGPHPATIATSAASETAVSIPAPGTYRFRLTATDGAASAAGEVVVTITRPGTITDLIAKGSMWDFLDNGTDQGTAWREVNFNSAGWKRGRAQLGYGDNDEVTLVDFGPDSANRYITTYFRHAFTLDSSLNVTGLRLRTLRDDGVVVYINGREAWRDQMPTGAINYRTQATAGIGGSGETTFFERVLEPNFVQPGVNVVAAEIHQFNGQSVDISFDLQLEATFNIINQAPQVNAGADREVAVGATITLEGAVSDDALPTAPGIPTISWTAGNAADAITLANADRARAAATFNRAGSFVLTLSANDGALTSSDQVTIIVGENYQAWAATHFNAVELADAAISGPDADPDHDTHANRDEQRTGTNPKDAASVLKLEVTAEGGIQFQALPNVGYIILHRAFDAATWQPHTTIPAEAAARPITVSNPQPGLYRISVP